MNKIEQEIAAASLASAAQDEDGYIRGRYLFPESFSGFAGHFPGNAILPAIVEIMTAVSLLGAHHGRKLHLAAVEDAKFLTPVRPDQEIEVSCRQRTVRGKELYEAQLSVAGTVTATMLLDLAVSTHVAVSGEAS